MIMILLMIKLVILPFLYSLLDSTSVKFQDLVIRQIPSIANMFDYVVFKQVSSSLYYFNNITLLLLIIIF